MAQQNSASGEDGAASDHEHSARGAAAAMLAEANDCLPYGMAIADPQMRIIYANRTFGELLHVGEDLSGCPTLGSLLAPGDGTPADASSDDGVEPISAGATQRIADGETIPLLRGGRTLAASSRLLANSFHLITIEDITLRRSLAARAEQLARQDPLTALPNRVVLGEHLAARLAASAADGQSTAVLCLDLDRFKLVNDTAGHAIGDKLLARVAERLRSVVADDDIVARLGGGEFAILQTSANQPADAEGLAARIVDLVGRVFLIEGHMANIGVSIGIAVAPRHGGDAEALLKSGDLALYRAKEEGRGRCRLFEPEMDRSMQARRSLEFELRKALGLREFELFYQPLFNFENDRIEGFEALLRWRHPVRGLVSPADFIPLAEELGIIIPIGEWALRTACAQAATWPDHIGVAVNLSPVQFTSPRLAQAVMNALASAKLAPSRLELEITESVLLHDTAGTLETLHRLRRMGVRIAMDDFGTGYSSLSYLRSFPFDKIKIDQSFVRGMSSSKDCVAIVRAIAGLASTLGVSTTAEGVETEEQRERVRHEGCTNIQGYLVSRPVPASETAGLIGTPSPTSERAAS